MIFAENMAKYADFGQIYLEISDIFLISSAFVAKTQFFRGFDPQIVIFDPMFTFEN